MDKDSRRAALIKAFDGVDDVKTVVLPMINDVVFLEFKLADLRTKLENEKLAQGGKSNPHVRIYKELLQQYSNCIKILSGVLRKDVPEDESPLRQFLNSRAKRDA